MGNPLSPLSSSRILLIATARLASRPHVQSNIRVPIFSLSEKTQPVPVRMVQGPAQPRGGSPLSFSAFLRVWRDKAQVALYKEFSRCCCLWLRRRWCQGSDHPRSTSLALSLSAGPYLSQKLSQAQEDRQNTLTPRYKKRYDKHGG